jgi:hypothetical protein
MIDTFWVQNPAGLFLGGEYGAQRQNIKKFMVRYMDHVLWSWSFGV